MRASSIITVNQLNGLLHNKRTVPTVTLRNLIFRICSNLLQIAKHLTVKAVNHGVGSTDHFLKFLSGDLCKRHLHKFSVSRKCKFIKSSLQNWHFKQLCKWYLHKWEICITRCQARCDTV